ncbi:MAG: hypothetical protein ABI665_07170 [Vicinamibacterales bacterium]
MGYGILGGLLAVTVSIVGLSLRHRKRTRNIDFGSVSDSWLAEYKNKTTD